MVATTYPRLSSDPLGHSFQVGGEVSADSRGPLTGIRIVAVEQYGAGPFGTMYLADLGADVIKVEEPSSGGDVSRYIPPGQAGTDSLFFEAFNRGKRSITLDLKSTAGREVFERLAISADAVFSNLRGGQAERLGLTYEDLGPINPAIVCVALTGYGGVGATSTLPAYDALIQAEAGWAALTGDPDDPPTKSGLSLADYVAGLTAMVGLLSGVLDARRTGLGRNIDSNLYDSALAMLSYPATWYLTGGYLASRLPMSAHPSIVPFQFFATSNGYIAVACAKEKFFRALVGVVGLPELLDDPRYADFPSRAEHRGEVLGLLTAAFAGRSTEDWLMRLRGLVPIAPVRSLEEALDVAELERRGMLVTYKHPELGDVRSIGSPISVGGYEPSYRAGPGLGSDTTAVLEEVGYDQMTVAALRERGAFGGPSHATSPASVGQREPQP